MLQKLKNLNDEVHHKARKSSLNAFKTKPPPRQASLPFPDPGMEQQQVPMSQYYTNQFQLQMQFLKEQQDSLTRGDGSNSLDLSAQRAMMARFNNDQQPLPINFTSQHSELQRVQLEPPHQSRVMPLNPMSEQQSNTRIIGGRSQSSWGVRSSGNKPTTEGATIKSSNQTKNKLKNTDPSQQALGTIPKSDFVYQLPMYHSQVNFLVQGGGLAKGETVPQQNSGSKSGERRRIALSGTGTRNQIQSQPMLQSGQEQLRLVPKEVETQPRPTGRKDNEKQPQTEESANQQIIAKVKILHKTPQTDHLEEEVNDSKQQVEPQGSENDSKNTLAFKAGGKPPQSVQLRQEGGENTARSNAQEPQQLQLRSLDQDTLTPNRGKGNKPKTLHSLTYADSGGPRLVKDGLTSSSLENRMNEGFSNAIRSINTSGGQNNGGDQASAIKEIQEYSAKSPNEVVVSDGQYKPVPMNNEGPERYAHLTSVGDIMPVHSLLKAEPAKTEVGPSRYSIPLTFNNSVQLDQLQNLEKKFQEQEDLLAHQSSAEQAATGHFKTRGIHHDSQTKPPTFTKNTQKSSLNGEGRSSEPPRDTLNSAKRTDGTLPSPNKQVFDSNVNTSKLMSSRDGNSRRVPAPYQNAHSTEELPMPTISSQPSEINYLKNKSTLIAPVIRTQETVKLDPSNSEQYGKQLEMLKSQLTGQNSHIFIVGDPKIATTLMSPDLKDNPTFQDREMQVDLISINQYGRNSNQECASGFSKESMAQRALQQPILQPTTKPLLPFFGTGSSGQKSLRDTEKMLLWMQLSFDDLHPYLEGALGAPESKPASNRSQAERIKELNKIAMIIYEPYRGKLERRQAMDFEKKLEAFRKRTFYSAEEFLRKKEDLKQEAISFLTNCVQEFYLVKVCDFQQLMEIQQQASIRQQIQKPSRGGTDDDFPFYDQRVQPTTKNLIQRKVDNHVRKENTQIMLIERFLSNLFSRGQAFQRKAQGMKSNIVKLDQLAEARVNNVDERFQESENLEMTGDLFKGDFSPSRVIINPKLKPSDGGSLEDTSKMASKNIMSQNELLSPSRLQLPPSKGRESSLMNIKVTDNLTNKVSLVNQVSTQNDETDAEKQQLQSMSRPPPLNADIQSKKVLFSSMQPNHRHITELANIEAEVFINFLFQRYKLRGEKGIAFTHQLSRKLYSLMNSDFVQKPPQGTTDRPSTEERIRVVEGVRIKTANGDLGRQVGTHPMRVSSSKRQKAKLQHQKFSKSNSVFPDYTDALVPQQKHLRPNRTGANFHPKNLLRKQKRQSREANAKNNRGFFDNSFSGGGSTMQFNQGGGRQASDLGDRNSSQRSGEQVLDGSHTLKPQLSKLSSFQPRPAFSRKQSNIEEPLQHTGTPESFFFKQSLDDSMLIQEGNPTNLKSTFGLLNPATLGQFNVQVVQSFQHLKKKTAAPPAAAHTTGFAEAAGRVNSVDSVKMVKLPHFYQVPPKSQKDILLRDYYEDKKKPLWIVQTRQGASGIDKKRCISEQQNRIHLKSQLINRKGCEATTQVKKMSTAKPEKIERPASQPTSQPTNTSQPRAHSALSAQGGASESRRRKANIPSDIDGLPSTEREGSAIKAIVPTQGFGVRNVLTGHSFGYANNNYAQQPPQAQTLQRPDEKTDSEHKTADDQRRNSIETQQSQVSQFHRKRTSLNKSDASHLKNDSFYIRKQAANQPREKVVGRKGYTPKLNNPLHVTQYNIELPENEMSDRKAYTSQMARKSMKRASMCKGSSSSDVRQGSKIPPEFGLGSEIGELKAKGLKTGLAGIGVHSQIALKTLHELENRNQQKKLEQIMMASNISNPMKSAHLLLGSDNSEHNKVPNSEINIDQLDDYEARGIVSVHKIRSQNVSMTAINQNEQEPSSGRGAPFYLSKPLSGSNRSKSLYQHRGDSGSNSTLQAAFKSKSSNQHINVDLKLVQIKHSKGVIRPLKRKSKSQVGGKFNNLSTTLANDPSQSSGLKNSSPAGNAMIPGSLFHKTAQTHPRAITPSKVEASSPLPGQPYSNQKILLNQPEEALRSLEDPGTLGIHPKGMTSIQIPNRGNQSNAAYRGIHGQGIDIIIEGSTVRDTSGRETDVLLAEKSKVEASSRRMTPKMEENKITRMQSSEEKTLQIQPSIQVGDDNTSFKNVLIQNNFRKQGEPTPREQSLNIPKENAALLRANFASTNMRSDNLQMQISGSGEFVNLKTHNSEAVALSPEERSRIFQTTIANNISINSGGDMPKNPPSLQKSGSRKSVVIKHNSSRVGERRMEEEGESFEEFKKQVMKEGEEEDFESSPIKQPVMPDNVTGNKAKLKKILKVNDQGGRAKQETTSLNQLKGSGFNSSVTGGESVNQERSFFKARLLEAKPGDMKRKIKARNPENAYVSEKKGKRKDGVEVKARPLFTSESKKVIAEPSPIDEPSPGEEYRDLRAISNTKEMEDMIRCNSFVITSHQPKAKIASRKPLRASEARNLKKDTGVEMDQNFNDLSDNIHSSLPTLTMKIGSKNLKNQDTSNTLLDKKGPLAADPHNTHTSFDSLRKTRDECKSHENEARKPPIPELPEHATGSNRGPSAPSGQQKMLAARDDVQTLQLNHDLASKSNGFHPGHSPGHNLSSNRMLLAYNQQSIVVDGSVLPLIDASPNFQFEGDDMLGEGNESIAETHMANTKSVLEMFERNEMANEKKLIKEYYSKKKEEERSELKSQQMLQRNMSVKARKNQIIHQGKVDSHPYLVSTVQTNIPSTRGPPGSSSVFTLPRKSDTLSSEMKLNSKSVQPSSYRSNIKKIDKFAKSQKKKDTTSMPSIPPSRGMTLQSQPPRSSQIVARLKEQNNTFQEELNNQSSTTIMKQNYPLVRLDGQQRQQESQLKDYMEGRLNSLDFSPVKPKPRTQQGKVRNTGQVAQIIVLNREGSKKDLSTIASGLQQHHSIIISNTSMPTLRANSSAGFSNQRYSLGRKKKEKQKNFVLLSKKINPRERQKLMEAVKRKQEQEQATHETSPAIIPSNPYLESAEAANPLIANLPIAPFSSQSANNPQEEIRLKEGAKKVIVPAAIPMAQIAPKSSSGQTPNPHHQQVGSYSDAINLGTIVKEAESRSSSGQGRRVSSDLKSFEKNQLTSKTKSIN